MGVILSQRAAKQRGCSPVTRVIVLCLGWAIYIAQADMSSAPFLQVNHGGTVRAVTFSPDGKMLASGGEEDADGEVTVKVWEIRTGRLTHTLEGFRGRVLCLAFAPNGTSLATGSEVAKGYMVLGGELKLWDARKWKTKWVRESKVHIPESLAFAPHRKTLASGGGGNVNLGTRTPER